MTNTLAYYDTKIITNVKIFMVQAPGSPLRINGGENGDHTKAGSLYKRRNYKTKCPFVQPGKQCYKKFYSRNLRIFVIIQSACPWQSFPAYLMFAEKAKSNFLEWSTSGRLLSYPQRTFDKAGNACQGQRL